MFEYFISGDKIKLKPSSKGSQLEQKRVKTCIKLFELNGRYLVNEKRREKRTDFKGWYKVYSESAPNSSHKQLAESFLRLMAREKAECAGMVRYFLREKRLGHLIP